MFKLSIIVAVYNMKLYLPKFLDSLDNNMLDGIEVIFVDDGSSDGSFDILRAWASKYDKYIKIVSKRNGGVSSARNAGLRCASGEYIIFADPDDYLEDDYARTILEEIKKNSDIDVFYFDFYDCDFNGNNNLVSISHFKEGLIDTNEFLSEFVADRQVRSYLCNKVIKRKHFMGLAFQEDIRCMEDAELLTDLFLKIKTVFYIKKPLYYYVARKGSLTRSENIDGSRKSFDIAIRRYNLYNKLLHDVSINMPAYFCYSFIRSAYINENFVDVTCSEKWIRKNIRKILFDVTVHPQIKKHCIFIYLGIEKYYLRLKK